MKTMLKMMRKDSEEYNFLHDALKSVEKVADFIRRLERTFNAAYGREGM